MSAPPKQRHYFGLVSNGSLTDAGFNGRINITSPHVCQDAWWTRAPRQGFTDLARLNYEHHMRGSQAERIVGNLQIEGAREREDAMRRRSKGWE